MHSDYLPLAIDMNPLKIHIVEDEIIIAYDLQDILSELKYVVNDISMSVEEATAKLATDDSDLFILDINLKGPLTGFELGRLLLEMQKPFIYMSSTVDREVLEKARQHVFLEKPFDVEDIMEAIETAVKV